MTDCFLRLIEREARLVTECGRLECEIENLEERLNGFRHDLLNAQNQLKETRVSMKNYFECENHNI